MPDTRSLRSSFAWVFAGNVVYSFALFFLIREITIHFSPQQLGDFALCLAILSPITIASGMQLRGILATDANNAIRFSTCFTIRCVTILLVPLGGLVAGVLVSATPVFLALMASAILFKSMEGISDTTYGQLQRSDKMNHIGIARGLRGVMLIIVSTITFRMTGNLVLGITLAGLSWGSIFLLYELPVALRSSQEKLVLQSTSETLPLFRQALPAAATLILVHAAVNLPAIFIYAMLGKSALGYYTAVAQALLLSGLIAGPLATAVAPRLAKYYHTSTKDFWRLYGKLFAMTSLFTLAGVVVSLVAGSAILRMLFGPDYAPYNQLLTFVIVASGIYMAITFASNGMLITRSFGLQMLACAINLAMLIIAIPLFIIGLGLSGAPIAIIACGFFLTLFYLYLVDRKLRFMTTLGVMPEHTP